MIAAIHVLRSKNSSIGSPKPRAFAMAPPTMAPRIPTIVVRRVRAALAWVARRSG